MHPFVTIYIVYPKDYFITNVAGSLDLQIAQIIPSSSSFNSLFFLLNWAGIALGHRGCWHGTLGTSESLDSDCLVQKLQFFYQFLYWSLSHCSQHLCSIIVRVSGKPLWAINTRYNTKLSSSLLDRAVWGPGLHPCNLLPLTLSSGLPKHIEVDRGSPYRFNFLYTLYGIHHIHITP